ncbi:MAG TPA: hypothetical protein PLS03_09205 [Terrimicrobiaceae bacterium]|nr:hypothetical protein [Terrimicrobiaceae bacterium]
MNPLRVLVLLLGFSAVVPLAPVRAMDAAAVMAKGEADSGEPSPELVEATKRLQELGVMKDPDYWIEHARKGRYCEGGEVADLMIAGASKIGKASNVEEAIAVLIESKVLQNAGGAEYWQKKAVAGAKSPGSFVEVMIIRLAEVL